MLNYELHDLYSLADMVRMNKWCLTITKRMRWVALISYMCEKRNACSVSGVKREENKQLQDLGVDGRIRLKWIRNIL